MVVVMVMVVVVMVVTVMVVVTMIEVMVGVGLMGVWVSGGGTVYPEANSPPRRSGAGCSLGMKAQKTFFYFPPSQVKNGCSLVKKDREKFSAL